MNRPVTWLVSIIALGIIAGVTVWKLGEWEQTEQDITLQPAVVADYLHAVIEAQRTIYTKQVVDALEGRVETAEHWKQEKALPLPAQMILDSGRLVAEKVPGFKYRLASLSPIYVWNAPLTDFEKTGLAEVAKNPDKPFTGFVRIGRDRFFQAMYADRAVSPACVKCHNTHINSPKRDYKLGDVMGGIIITLPLEPHARNLRVSTDSPR